MTIGKRLRDLRMARVPRPTQTEVGHIISDSTDAQAQAKIKRIEADKQSPTVPEALALADYFGVDRMWFLTGKDPTPNHACAGLEEHCPKFKNILLSDHEVIKDAFVANLKAFNYSIDKERKMEKTIEDLSSTAKANITRIDVLEKAMSSGCRTDTDAVASSNIGKQGT
jgi:hypothetical protein